MVGRVRHALRCGEAHSGCPDGRTDFGGALVLSTLRSAPACENSSARRVGPVTMPTRQRAGHVSIPEMIAGGGFEKDGRKHNRWGHRVCGGSIVFGRPGYADIVKNVSSKKKHGMILSVMCITL